MKPIDAKQKRRPKSEDLVKSMLVQLSLQIASDEHFTQEFVAELVGCHRHWFRRHKLRYNIKTGELDDKGLTPLEMIDVFERERSKEKVYAPVEVALQNADAKVTQQQLIIKALEEKLEAQRRLLHLISINTHRLGISDEELFRKPVD